MLIIALVRRGCGQRGAIMVGAAALLACLAVCILVWDIAMMLVVPFFGHSLSLNPFLNPFSLHSRTKKMWGPEHTSTP